MPLQTVLGVLHGTVGRFEKLPVRWEARVLNHSRFRFEKETHTVPQGDIYKRQCFEDTGLCSIVLIALGEI
jgi:hypothetical protein